MASAGALIWKRAQTDRGGARPALAPPDHGPVGAPAERPGAGPMSSPRIRRAGRSRTFASAAIESMASEELRGEPVGYPVACASARARIPAAQTEQGRYAESGVAVGSFSALRSIPFRVIFALGLGETHISRAREARPARLEARAPARRRRQRQPARPLPVPGNDCWPPASAFFFPGLSRDALTGQTLEPSPVIRELKLIARGYLAQAELDALTTIHPAAATICEYFPDLRGQGADQRPGEFRSPRP